MRWSLDVKDPIDNNINIRMPDMRLVDIKTGTCNGTYVKGKISILLKYLKGTWSCMTAVFYVQREMMHHIIQVNFYKIFCFFLKKIFFKLVFKNTKNFI